MPPFLSVLFFFRTGGTACSGDAEHQVRVVAAMSSGEGAEETAKDAGDIEAFFKTGKTRNTSALGRFETREELLPVVQLQEGTLFGFPVH